MYKCFATTNKGLEELLKLELEQLGAADIVSVNAGANFTADLNTIMKINLYSRIASRIMLQVGFDTYSNEEDIYNLARSIRWQDWFQVNNSIKVSTSAIRSPLKSLEFITLKVKDAICDRFIIDTTFRPDINKHDPDIKIYNFLTTDTITIYIDTSGDSLFKRGYRKNKLEAPLKENLACGLVVLSKWDKKAPFYDPMCGSGTIAIEAASMALNIPPGFKRNFSFSKLKPFDLSKFQEIKNKAESEINYAQKLEIYASDIDSKAISIAKDNIYKSGLSKYIKLSQVDFLTTIKPSSQGIMIFNPPYGVRLEEQESLAKFYPFLGSHLKKNYAGWNCYILSADLTINKLMRLKPSRKTPLFNGALECRLFEFKMVDGSNR